MWTLWSISVIDHRILFHHQWLISDCPETFLICFLLCAGWTPQIWLTLICQQVWGQSPCYRPAGGWRLLRDRAGFGEEPGLPAQTQSWHVVAEERATPSGRDAAQHEERDRDRDREVTSETINQHQDTRNKNRTRSQTDMQRETPHSAPLWLLLLQINHSINRLINKTSYDRGKSQSGVLYSLCSGGREAGTIKCSVFYVMETIIKWPNSWRLIFCWSADRSLIWFQDSTAWRWKLCEKWIFTGVLTQTQIDFNLKWY